MSNKKNPRWLRENSWKDFQKKVIEKGPNYG